MTNNENYVRELAYQIWESEGRPSGESERHWKLAILLAEEKGEDEPDGSTPLEPIDLQEPD